MKEAYLIFFEEAYNRMNEATIVEQDQILLFPTRVQEKSVTRIQCICLCVPRMRIYKLAEVSNALHSY
jgi:hypothetical protein